MGATAESVPAYAGGKHSGKLDGCARCHGLSSLLRPLSGDEPHQLGSLDTQTEFDTQLPLGSAYYLAAQPLQEGDAVGEISNISYFQTALEPEHETIAVGSGGPTVVLESGLGDGMWP